MHVLIIETLIASIIGCLSNAPPIVVNRKVKEIGFEPLLIRPFCHALRNVHAGQLV